jgi:hypothetical protein
MRPFIFAFLLIAVASELRVSAKKFEECEFTKELFEKHQIPRYQVYKYVCVSTLGTTYNEVDQFRLYRYDDKSCGQDAPSGICNITCTSLKDDDITDDIKCASAVFKKNGRPD